MDNTNRNVLIFASGTLTLLIVAYANHFYNGFHFDDMHAIVNNVYIRSLKNIPSFFVDPKMFSSDPTHWGLRSLVTTSLAIDYWLGGSLDPFWFQFSTFCWHVVLCVILYFVYKSILKKTFQNNWASYTSVAAAGWYALHEVNAETLNYVISRSDVLSTLLIVASLAIYIAWPQKRKYCFYIIPAFIGVFAKETVLVLVIILFFYILLFEKKLSFAGLFKAKNFKTILNAFWLILPLTVVVVITQIYTLSRIASIPGISNPLLPYVLTQTFVWVHYFIAFFLPVNLSADSDWGIIQNAFDERIIIGCLFVIGMVITIIKTSAKAETKPIAFGLIWFAAALLPTSLAPFAEVTNDHRMYFPFIGLTLSVVTYAGILIKRYQPSVKIKPYYTYIAAALLCIYGLNAYGVYHRNEVWHTEESLWLDVTQKSPGNGRGLMNYGVAEMARANYPVAERHFIMARRDLPFYSALYINLGVLYGATHKTREADQNFRTAIALSPADFSTYMFYAQYLLDNGRILEAQTMAEKAIKENYYSVPTLNILLTIYNKLTLWNQLKQTAQHLLAIIPDDKGAKNFLLVAQSHSTASATTGDKAHVTAEDYLNLSLQYYNDGQYQQCITACKQALSLKPNYADAYNNEGAAYIKLQLWSNSIEACKKALAINPQHVLAKGNLKFAKSQLK